MGRATTSPRTAAGRLATGALLCAVLAACTEAPQAAEPTPTPAAEPTPITTAEPAPDPLDEPTDAPEALEDEDRLAELRAGRNFIELAEHDRAPGGRWSQFTYSQFGIAGDGELVGEWTNKRELWDSFVPAFRDECLLAGEPATEPMWDQQLMIPVGVSALWNDATTEGRGQFMQANCVYLSEPSGKAIERYEGFLIETDEDGAGILRARMGVLEIEEYAFSDASARAEHLDARFWEWVLARPKRP